MATANKKLTEKTTASVNANSAESKVSNKTGTKKTSPKVNKVVTETVEISKDTQAAKLAGKNTVSTQSSKTISAAQHAEMVATAAYYIAERRGFAAGYANEDWLAAEVEINTRLSA